MSKKRFTGITAVLAVAAFVVAPAAAQAVPHLFKNGVEVEQGCLGEEASCGLDLISWGTLTLETKTVGTIVCENEFAGDAFNPVGGGAAEGFIDAYAVYNCTNEACEGGFKSKQEIVPEGLDKFGEWEVHIFEPKAGEFRLKVGNTIEGSPTQIKFLIACPPAGLGEIKIKSKGELTPLVRNGTIIGSAPSKTEFGEGSGELEIAKVKEGKVNGTLKVMGYEAGEIVVAKNS